MSQDPSIPTDDDGQAYVAGQLEALQTALADHDGEAGVRVLRHLAAEYDAKAAEQLMDGMISAGLDRLAAKVQAGEPGAIETLINLLNLGKDQDR
jgi:hypothetical protein